MKSRPTNLQRICEYAKRSIRRCRVNSSKWWPNTIARRPTIARGARDVFSGNLKSVSFQISTKYDPRSIIVVPLYFVAGRTTTNEELEEMLEQGNLAVFTEGVMQFSLSSVSYKLSLVFNIFQFVKYIVKYRWSCRLNLTVSVDFCFDEANPKFVTNWFCRS